MRATIAIKTTCAVALCICSALTGHAAESAIPFRVDHNAPLESTESIVKDTADQLHLRVEFNGIDGDRVPAFLYIPKDENE